MQDRAIIGAAALLIAIFYSSRGLISLCVDVSVMQPHISDNLHYNLHNYFLAPQIKSFIYTLLWQMTQNELVA